MNLSVATYEYEHWSLILWGDFFVVYFMIVSVLRPRFVKWQDDSWKMNWKGFWRCSHDLITVLSWSLPGRTEENRQNLSQDNQCPGWDWNSAPLKYKSNAHLLHHPAQSERWTQWRTRGSTSHGASQFVLFTLYC